mgnify:CR=1 FL=1
MVVLQSDGSVKVSWDAVDGAKAYVLHYGGGNQNDGHAATLVGYSGTTDWTLSAADVPAHAAGDTIYFYAQAFNKVGTGSTDIEKAQNLNTTALGSDWSALEPLQFA